MRFQPGLQSQTRNRPCTPHSSSGRAHFETSDREPEEISDGPACMHHSPGNEVPVRETSTRETDMENETMGREAGPNDDVTGAAQQDWSRVEQEQQLQQVQNGAEQCRT